MSEITLVLPHQLFADHPGLGRGRSVRLLEEPLLFTQFAFHRQKLAYHRATMAGYAAALRDDGHQVQVVAVDDPRADVRRAVADLAADGIRCVHVAEPADDWLDRRLRRACRAAGVALEVHASPGFINRPDDLDAWFAGRRTWRLADFYRRERTRRGILLDVDGGPLGGKWSLDAENRRRYPRGMTPPAVTPPPRTRLWTAAVAAVGAAWPDNPGALPGQPLYPHTREQALAWLDEFLAVRFRDFGPYEDAIVADEVFLHHSVLTPALNVGLLTPGEVLAAALAAADDHGVPLNSLEGFVRQVIGWREFMHGVYRAAGGRQRTANVFGFDRPLPAGFWDGTTGLPPVDLTVAKVLRTGYCHHIERLMVLCNLLLLCETDPDEVYAWFMALFIDAYDWVMVPNVYGMSQYADGGLLATKPYVGGSNYLRKMGNYPRGGWEQVWDGLFWRFIDRRRDAFAGNPRSLMMVRNFDRMDPARRRRLLDAAETWLDTGEVPD